MWEWRFGFGLRSYESAWDRSKYNYLEVLAVSSSFEELLPRLPFTCFCFICWTVSLVFICDYCKCRRLSEPYFLSSWWVHPLFHVRTATHILQFSSRTVPLTFVWLSHNAYSLAINLLVSFYFIHSPYFRGLPQFFASFFWVELSHFSLCERHTNNPLFSFSS